MRYEIKEHGGAGDREYRVWDTATGARVATCTMSDHAELVLSALNSQHGPTGPRALRLQEIALAALPACIAAMGVGNEDRCVRHALKVAAEFIEQVEEML